MMKIRQNGQGLIEYMLIIVVVTVALVAFASAYRDSAETVTNVTTNSLNEGTAALQ